MVSDLSPPSSARATAVFAAGSGLVASYFSGDSQATSTLLAGVLLEVYTGLAVAGIGLAMLPLLRPYGARLARAYLALRALECLTIILLGAWMLARHREVGHDDLVIYSFTAVGGIVFSYLLAVSGLVPGSCRRWACSATACCSWASWWPCSASPTWTAAGVCSSWCLAGCSS
jgi:hypothetical protein